MTNTMTNTCNRTTWNGFAASVPGSGHIRRGIPCQDASSVMIGKRPAVIVCDGRGSANLSHIGAQKAVEYFRTQVSILEPFFVGILDEEKCVPEKWDNICKLIYRTLTQAKMELAEAHNCLEKEFDFTVAFAIAGEHNIGFFQVGDGTLVVRKNGVSETVFMPDKGEFANQTHFVRPGGETQGKYHAVLIPADGVSGISATSDGPEHLMFKLSDMTPGPVFESMFNDIANNHCVKQDLMDYLTRREWDKDPRGTDDRSIAILARLIDEAECTVPESVSEEATDEETPIIATFTDTETESGNEAEAKAGEEAEEVTEEPMIEKDEGAEDINIRMIRKSAMMQYIVSKSAVIVSIATMCIAAAIGVTVSSITSKTDKKPTGQKPLENTVSDSESATHPENEASQQEVQQQSGGDELSTDSKSAVPETGATPADSTINDKESGD